MKRKAMADGKEELAVSECKECSFKECDNNLHIFCTFSHRHEDITSFYLHLMAHPFSEGEDFPESCPLEKN